MASYKSLEPTELHGRLTDARHIQGGYFVVKQFSDLSSDEFDFNFTMASDTYTPDGTIVEGSRCYCQKEQAEYKCVGKDADNKAIWERVTSVHGGDTTTYYGDVLYQASEGLSLFYRPVSKDYQVDGIGTCPDKNVVIPSTHDGIPITSIKSRAFANCTNITSVIIGDNVELVGSYAFEGCTNLKTVKIPNSVTSMGGSTGGVFNLCPNLSSIFIPSSVKTMGWDMFDVSDKLTIYCELATAPSGWASRWTNCSNIKWGHPRLSAFDSLVANINTIVKVIYSISKREDFNDNILWPQLVDVDGTNVDWDKYVGYVTPTEEPNEEWGEYI